MYQYLTSPPDKTLLKGYCTDYIDVRDVAQAFVAALKTEAAGGRRFVLDAGEILTIILCFLVLKCLPGAVTYQNLCAQSSSRAKTPHTDCVTKFDYRRRSA